ncbi:MAG: hypothetical protein LBN23_05855 [Paludibacter sp.]|jgi:hypothetical protein|nr:hypothetical protein [Paludibacter sp.]
MKKLFIIGLFCIVAMTISAQQYVVNEQLVGRWELCTPDGKIMASPNVRQKIYTENSYVVLEVNKETNTTLVDFVGTVVAESEGKIVETPIYTNEMIKNMLAKKFSFFYIIEGDHLYLKGIDNSFNEIWVKISK